MVEKWKIYLWVVLGFIFNQCGTLFTEKAWGNCKLGTKRGEELYPFPPQLRCTPVKMCPTISLTKTATSLWFGGGRQLLPEKACWWQSGRGREHHHPSVCIEDSLPLYTCSKAHKPFKVWLETTCEPTVFLRAADAKLTASKTQL